MLRSPLQAQNLGEPPGYRPGCSNSACCRRRSCTFLYLNSPALPGLPTGLSPNAGVILDACLSLAFRGQPITQSLEPQCLIFVPSLSPPVSRPPLSPLGAVTEPVLYCHHLWTLRAPACSRPPAVHVPEPGGASQALAGKVNSSCCTLAGAEGSLPFSSCPFPASSSAVLPPALTEEGTLGVSKERGHACCDAITE